MQNILQEYKKKFYVFIISIFLFWSFTIPTSMVSIWIIGEVLSYGAKLIFFLVFTFFTMLSTIPIYILNFKIRKIVDEPKKLIILSIGITILFLLFLIFSTPWIFMVLFLNYYTQS